ncbi:MarR family winged helix-turn-helix transcriptional regulator [Paracidovorax valerianellae]|uniref:DNA-binding transcriptional regulator, MarR family n=1 Tax=Paracidovorax valerianellae TaxID=187868 RepID=A0A1G6RR56_9BURK|nr:MarR family transcriptional regulator [Paracidovorax valerianellae]MDA8446033.1 MarR family transcriptional regulator [Paracidovorax valerianellae]SDD06901.1 DNA-binding transcriptional regulator, MarR family [Paracidovorax valerianellae]
MSKVDDALLLDRQLCFSIYSTSLAMMQAYKPLLKSLDLTYPQYLVMLALWERDGITLKSLAEQLHLDPGSLTPIVKRLESDGLLQRLRDPKDERSLALVLTPAGRDLRARATEVNATFAGLCGLSDGALADLRQGLVELRSRLES